MIALTKVKMRGRKGEGKGSSKSNQASNDGMGDDLDEFQVEEDYSLAQSPYYTDDSSIRKMVLYGAV